MLIVYWLIYFSDAQRALLRTREELEELESRKAASTNNQVVANYEAQIEVMSREREQTEEIIKRLTVKNEELKKDMTTAKSENGKLLLCSFIFTVKIVGWDI